MGTADFRIGKPVAITDAKLVSTSVAEDDFPVWVAGGTYAVGDQRIRPSTHRIYMCKVGHTGVTTAPESDSTNWKDIGATNRWKMFDKVVNSQTVAPESVSVTLAPGEVVNTLLLMNLAGSQVTVAQSDSGYTRTRSLVRHNVLSWYDFYYQLPIRAGDAIFGDIPPYPASTLTITVDNPGADAAIGCCFLGRPFFVGTTQWEFDGGILSYSTSNEDTFGNVTMVRRPNAKTLRFDVAIPRGYEDEAYRILRDHTDVEVFIIGTDNYTMSYSYGFLGDWRVPVSIKGKTAPIEFKGLI